MTFPKTCACGRTYSVEEWRDIVRLGILNDGVELTEMKNCACGSTMGMAIGPSPDLPETIAELWMSACRQQVVSALTRKDWDACEMKWKLLADAEQVAGHTQNVVVYLKLADEARVKHDIQQAVTG